jgi:hypothetical protein
VGNKLWPAGANRPKLFTAKLKGNIFNNFLLRAVEDRLPGVHVSVALMPLRFSKVRRHGLGVVFRPSLLEYKDSNFSSNFT